MGSKGIVIFYPIDNNLSMPRHQFFIIGSAVIFVLERALPALTSWPLFIFPLFVILFVLTGKDDIADLPYIAIASVFFDFFSGFHFGLFTLALLAVDLLIHFFKGRVNVNSKSFFSLFAYSLIFTLIFIAMLSFKSTPQIIFSNWVIIIIETVLVFSIFGLINSRFKR